MRFRRKQTAVALTAEQQLIQNQLSRRRFLKATGAVGIGLVVCLGGAVGLNYVRQSGDSFLPELTDDPNAWLRIEPDNRVRLLVNKVEMGQGIATAAAQIVAEELEVPFERVTYVNGTTDELPYDMLGTAGSISVSSLYPVLRSAAAEARETLIELAASRTGKTTSEFLVRDGRIVHQDDPDLAFEYGALVRNQEIVRVVKNPRLRQPRDYTVIGQNVPRLDIPDKVNGKAKYGYDIQIEGMLAGRIARAPVIGATIQNIDVEAARSVPGVVAVVHDDNFVGVVAETAAQAADGLQELQLTWRQPRVLLEQAQVEALLVPHGGTTLHEAGNVEQILEQATRRITAEYRSGFATHAPIEPQVGVADVQVDRAKVWAPTQAPFALRQQIADITGLAEENVTIVPTLVGGGFGRKAVSDAAVEAARLSQAVGRPVRVAWDRSEEFSEGFVRPPSVTRLAAALDSQGNIAAWQQDLATGFVLFAFFPWFLRLLFGGDSGASRGAVGPYRFPNHRVTATVNELPVKTGPWRGLGGGPNVFALEQFMDELATEVGADPLEYRIRHLDTDVAGVRMRRVLQTVADAAGWGSPIPVNHGRGIACGMDAGTFVAEVAEVEVDRVTGTVRVKRVFAAVDCGLAINPDSVKAQTEGAIMMGLSAALKEEIELKDGRWGATMFGEYSIFTIEDAPEIDVTIISNPDTAPGGMGEPPLFPAAAAVGNAIANAIGARVRIMPMTAERVLTALPGFRQSRDATRPRSWSVAGRDAL